MSEPNSPLKPQAESELESSLDWWNPFPELTDSDLSSSEPEKTELLSPLVSQSAEKSSAEKSSAEKSSAEKLSVEQPAEQPTEQPMAPLVSAEAPVVVPFNPLISPDVSPAVSSTLSSAEPVINPSEPPNLIDLISLIQELNQCNGVLLDRVSQLEEALERSQQALQGQIERSPELLASAQTDFAQTNFAQTNFAQTDSEAAAVQIANLFNQLEFAHQTNQRQNILIETLTAELESNQERVAQLEREAALLQQRYNEQTQFLVQSEGACRDLQARLHRQQRYTLQFKAALEKCLEMPMPQTGAEMMAPPVDSLLLPKAQQIQPWSQTAAQESLLPWMKRFKTAADGASLETEETFAAEVMLTELPAELAAELAFAEEEKAIEELARPTLSAVQLPVLAPLHSDAPSSADTPLQNSAEAQEPTMELAEASLTNPSQSAEASSESASISYDLKALGAAPSNSLLTHIEAVVQPLADRLAEALLFQATGAEAAEIIDGTEPVIAQQSEPAIVLPAEFPIAETDEVIITDPDSLLASAMSEAEDALWQDLARLMEGSTEEAIKASLTGDLAAFESLSFNGGTDGTAPNPPSVSSQPELPMSELPRSEPQQNVGSGVIAELPFATEKGTKTSNPGGTPHPGIAADAHASAREAAVPALAANANSPSPLLHPFRQAKPKRSLSSVELPSFLRQEDSKPLPT